MEKALFTIGIFAGIFNSKGELLLRRRDCEPYLGKWELPGGAVLKSHLEIGDERAIGKALQERILDEIGVSISPQRMPAMYPTIPKKGDDIAFAVIIGIFHENTLFRGEAEFVSLEKLVFLAEYEELVSGKQRMYRMCLRMFASRDCPNSKYREEAGYLLSRL
ncbi:MAG TPA: NUDIX domain-containing protein [Candidatus Pacearchaeota archaeon]|nr:NUDIX domain-containing protein [Candidatus Parcubacteria bacterium]HOC53470.1 NUDIX domain-containing protein [Candidatus Pacearchaeota archaeon]HQM24282.1 NUDIX domain-containing protein [Candidatus Pacearchaeota archaeon]